MEVDPRMKPLSSPRLVHLLLCLSLLAKTYLLALFACFAACVVLLRWSWENGAHPLAASGQGLDSFTVSMPRLLHRPLPWRLSPRSGEAVWQQKHLHRPARQGGLYV